MLNTQLGESRGLSVTMGNLTAASMYCLCGPGAMARNFAAPIWLTSKQAAELDGRIREGEKGSLVVYADSITCM